MSVNNNNKICQFFNYIGNISPVQAFRSSETFRVASDRFGKLNLSLNTLQPHIDDFCAFQFVDDARLSDLEDRIQEIKIQMPIWRDHILGVKTQLPNRFSAQLLSDPDSLEKRVKFLEDVSYIPMIEGVLFQGVIQDFFLTRLPRMLLPCDQKEAVDSWIAKGFRVIITTSAYTATRFLDPQSSEAATDIEKLVPTAMVGFFFSVLKESGLGVSGSIGARILVNAALVFHQNHDLDRGSFSPPATFSTGLVPYLNLVSDRGVCPARKNNSMLSIVLNLIHLKQSS